jgi:hypothetical protein
MWRARWQGCTPPYVHDTAAVVEGPVQVCVLGPPPRRAGSFKVAKQLEVAGAWRYSAGCM